MRNFFLLLLATIVLFNYSFSQHKILYIGNSYTYVNDLPSMISQMYNSAGLENFYESNTPGGATFQQHCTSSIDKINSDNWDFVVLQEQSQLPSFPEGQFLQESFPYGNQLCNAIKDNDSNTKIVFYMTWGRKNGDSQNCQFFEPLCTYEGMDSMLNLRYTMFAQQNHALLSPVGAVWHYIRDNYPQLELYQSDESHPSYFGSYVAACCFFTIFTNTNPNQISWNGNVTDEQAEIAKHSVKKIVYDSLSKWNFTNYNLEDDSTSIKDYLFSNISIFPNPVSNYLTINNLSYLQIQLQLFDCYGRLLYFDKIRNTEKIDLSDLDNGIYFLNIKYQNQIFLKKIIVLH